MIGRSLDDYVCQEDTALSSALEKMDANKKGFLVILASGKVSGVLTDGDIRRYLILNKDINTATAKDVCNSVFVFGHEEDSQEKLICLFDSKIKFLPILDSNHKLVTIQFFDEIRNLYESEMIRARAPARITFGGGGSDKFDYFKNWRGLCINAAIKKYAFCSVLKRSTQQGIKIVSSDFDAVWEFEDFRHLMSDEDPRLLIYKRLASFINLQESVSIHTQCDFPIGSGLGGSSSLSVAMLQAFLTLRGINTSKLNLAKQAYKLERISMDIKGGWQDQYAAAVGGINAIHFSYNKHQVHNLRLSPEILNELQASLYLCYSGISHNSSAIHQSIDFSTQKRSLTMKKTVQLADDMLHALTEGDLSGFDKNMNENWKLKTKYSKMITNESLDQKIDHFRSSGASSAKILGAGGGGYFLVRVPAEADQYFRASCVKSGFIPERVLFDMEGVVSW
jgi:D-glycero-alpha-D-manno-heptose-7-phosphate kinase